MEMTIEEIEFALNSIKIVLEHTEKGYYPEQFKTHEECLKEVMDMALKYQKIEEIVKFGNANELGFEYVGEKITEVMEDG